MKLQKKRLRISVRQLESRDKTSDGLRVQVDRGSAVEPIRECTRGVCATLPVGEGIPELSEAPVDDEEEDRLGI